MQHGIKYGLLALGLVLVLIGVSFSFTDPESTLRWLWLAGLVVMAGGLVLVDTTIGIIAAALVGAGANGALLYEKATDAGVCQANGIVSCAAAISGDWGTWFDGTPIEMPITLPGLAFFLAVAAAGLLGAVTSRGDSDRSFYGITFLLSVASLGLSAVLASVLIAEGTLCPFCVSIYGVTVVTTWGSLHGLGYKFGSIFSDELFAGSASTIPVTFIAVMGVAFAMGGIGSPSDKVAAPQTADDLAKYYEATLSDVPTDGTEPTFGSADAPYTIVEFASYGCPHCAEASKMLKPWLPSQPDVKLLFRSVSGECQGPFDAADAGLCRVAAYAECANEQGAFWDVNGDYFINQRHLYSNGFAVDDLEAIVSARGLDVERVRACARNPETLRGLRRDAMAFDAIGGRGVPAFYVKGVLDSGEWVKTDMRNLKKLLSAHRKLSASTTSDAP